MKHPSWQQTEQESCTLLHQAPDEGILNLLNNIAQKPNIREIINQTDYKGDTVLHLALQTSSLTIIAILIKLGADLFIPNHKKITPIILISQLAADVQLFILRQSGREKRDSVLQFYKELLIQDPNLVHARNVYCRFAGLLDKTVSLPK